MRRYFLFFVVLILFPILGISSSGMAESLSGNWDNQLTLKPDNILDGYSSTLQVDFRKGRMDFSSISKFSLSKLKKQEFEFGYSYANYSLDIDSKFDPSNLRLSSVSGTATVSLLDVVLSDKLELNYNAGSDQYDSKSTFIVVGNISGGITAELTTVFGGGGSGASLPYKSTKWEMWGQSIGCVDFSSTTKFNSSTGFKKSTAEFGINSPSLPISFSVDLTFKNNSKSVSLNPSIGQDWGFIDVYTGLDWSQPDIEGLVIKGFGLSGVSLGSSTFSSYFTLGNYDVHDINNNYKDGYDQVISLSADGDIGLSLDLYGNSDSGGVLGMSFFKGSSSFSVTRGVNFGMAVEMDLAGSDSGLAKAVFSVDYEF